MSRLAIVAYPALSSADREWIEGVRARHDPRASRIAAHVTLVFPTDVAAAPLLAEVGHVLRAPAAIPIVLGCAAALPDTIRGGHYVSLLVAEGRRQLLSLHETLYAALRAKGRLAGIPFVPHVTVAAHRDIVECERIARGLNAQSRVVRARIDSVDVVEVAEPMVRTIAKIPLG